MVLLNTQKTRDALHVLQSKYDANHREIRKLTMFISANGLAENERFLSSMQVRQNGAIGDWL